MLEFKLMLNIVTFIGIIATQTGENVSEPTEFMQGNMVLHTSSRKMQLKQVEMWKFKSIH